MAFNMTQYLAARVNSEIPLPLDGGEKDSVRKSPPPSYMEPVPNKCALDGCDKEAKMQYEYCCKWHASLANPVRVCELQGCPNPANGNFRHCCKDHALRDGTTPQVRVHVPPQVSTLIPFTEKCIYPQCAQRVTQGHRFCCSKHGVAYSARVKAGENLVPKGKQCDKCVFPDCGEMANDGHCFCSFEHANQFKAQGFHVPAAQPAQNRPPPFQAPPAQQRQPIPQVQRFVAVPQVQHFVPIPQVQHFVPIPQVQHFVPNKGFVKCALLECKNQATQGKSCCSAECTFESIRRQKLALAQQQNVGALPAHYVHPR